MSEAIEYRLRRSTRARRVRVVVTQEGGVPDHSRCFWALLAGRCPEYRDHARWLRRNGASLRH